MRKFYQTTTKYLLDHLPVGKALFKDLACLNPQLQKVNEGLHAAQQIARRIPQVITEEEIPQLTDEWKVYQVQDIPENWYISGQKDDGSAEFSRIDHYWKKVLDQKSVTAEPCYKLLAKLVSKIMSSSGSWECRS